MADVKHTPGPWFLGGDSDTGLWISGPDISANVICDIVGRNGNGVAPLTVEDEGNADLIAAAPELLDACEAAIPELRCLFRQATGKPTDEATGSVKAALDKLAAAIAKARGEEVRRA